MDRLTLSTLATAALALLASSCQTYDPNNPNDPFNQQLNAAYGAPGYGAAPQPQPYGAQPYGAQPYGTTPQQASNPAPPQPTPQPKPKPPVQPAAVKGDIGRLLQLTNYERSRNGAGTVRPDARLTNAAQNQSQYQAATKVQSHVGPSGERAGTRMLGQGYVWRAFAENIAKADTAEKAITQWMNSPPHRANLLNPIYTDVGIGYANGYWTIVFGRPR